MSRPRDFTRLPAVSQLVAVLGLLLPSPAFPDVADDPTPSDARPGYEQHVDRLGTFVIGSSGIESWHRVNATRELETDFSFYVAPRKIGEASLPFLRADFVYLDLDTSGDAFDYRVEIGYGPFAVQARETRLDTRRPEDEQDLVQLHFLYRMSYAAVVEIDIGLGTLTVDLPEREESFSFTLPILIHPTDHYGFEFRPAWSEVSGESVSDYDLSLLLGARYVSLKLGYRWVESVTDTFSGPQVGAAIRW